jgi:ATP-dependent helicase/nuclease subunit A
LNLLYVAFTRPECGLFILSPQLEKKDKLNDTSQLIQQVVEEISSSYPTAQGERNGFRTITLGERSAPPNHVRIPKSELNVPVSKRGPGPQLKLRRKAREFVSAETSGISEWKIDEGILLHQVFERMRLVGDLLPALSQLEYEGLLTKEDASYLRKSLPSLFEDEEVAGWFSPEWKYRNECEILLPDGHLKRPDRVLFQSGRTLVIDYKFGQMQREEHILQVREYLNLLRDAGFPAPAGFVWYVKARVKIPVKPD